jgi:hypothetical protein
VLVGWVTYAGADGGALDMAPFNLADGVITFQTALAPDPPDLGFALEIDDILVSASPGLCP